MSRDGIGDEKPRASAFEAMTLEQQIQEIRLRQTKQAQDERAQELLRFCEFLREKHGCTDVRWSLRSQEPGWTRHPSSLPGLSEGTEVRVTCHGKSLLVWWRKAEMETLAAAGLLPTEWGDLLSPEERAHFRRLGEAVLVRTPNGSFVDGPTAVAMGLKS